MGALPGPSQEWDTGYVVLPEVGPTLSSSPGGRVAPYLCLPASLL